MCSSGHFFELSSLISFLQFSVSTHSLTHSLFLEILFSLDVIETLWAGPLIMLSFFDCFPHFVLFCFFGRFPLFYLFQPSVDSK